MAGGGAAQTTDVNGPLTNNYHVSIGGAIIQGNIGTGASTQQGSSSATGG